MYEDFYYEDEDYDDDDDNKKYRPRNNHRTRTTMNKKFSTPSWLSRRLVLTVLIILVIMFIVHNAPSSDVEIILDANKMRLEKVERSSMILDVLRKKKLAQEGLNQNNADQLDENANEEPAIPAFRLITEFKNGIYFYNIHEPTESWVR